MLSHSISKNIFPHLLNIIKDAGGDVGTGPHNRFFVKEVENMSYVRLNQTVRYIIQKNLPTTGRPADVELIGDGGSFGQYYRAGGDEFFCGGCTVPWPTWPFRLPLPLGWVCTAGNSSAQAEADQMRQLVDSLGIGPLEDFMVRQVGAGCGDQKCATGGEWGMLYNLKFKLIVLFVVLPVPPAG